MQENNRRYLVNGTLMALSIGYFIYLNTVGLPDDVIIIMKYGGLYLEAFQKGERWRILVSIFMHVSIWHILFAMLSQYIVGERLERALGEIKYLIMFFMCGIGSNLVWIKLELNELERNIDKKMIFTVGTSGAICGLLGGLLYVTQANKGKYYRISSYHILLALILWIVFGLFNKNISNDTHISGFIIGYLLGVILYRRPKTQDEIERNRESEIKLIEDKEEDDEDNWEDLN